MHHLQCTQFMQSVRLQCSLQLVTTNEGEERIEGLWRPTPLKAIDGVCNSTGLDVQQLQLEVLS